MNVVLKTVCGVLLAFGFGTAAAASKPVLNDEYLVGRWWCLAADDAKDTVSLSRAEYRADHTFSSKSVLTLFGLFRISAEEKGTWKIDGDSVRTHSALLNIKRESDNEEGVRALQEADEIERTLTLGLGGLMFREMKEQEGRYDDDVYRVSSVSADSFRVSVEADGEKIEGRCSRVKNQAE